MPGVFNTAATPPPVPLPVSSITGKLCCDHRHFMRNGYRHFMNQPSHALNTPLMQYALKRVCLHIHLQMKRHQIYHAEPRHRRSHLRPATQASYASSIQFHISEQASIFTNANAYSLSLLFVYGTTGVTNSAVSSTTGIGNSGSSPLAWEWKPETAQAPCCDRYGPGEATARLLPVLQKKQNHALTFECLHRHGC